MIRYLSQNSSLAGKWRASGAVTDPIKSRLSCPGVDISDVIRIGRRVLAEDLIALGKKYAYVTLFIHNCEF